MESISPDKTLDAQAQGRNAAVIAGLLKPFIDSMMSQIAHQLIMMYRSGTTEHDQILGKVAELSALSNLMSTLQAAHQRGVAATQKEYQNAGTP